jgi:histidine kinase-like protein/acetyltransferase (GNAT) family protein
VPEFRSQLSVPSHPDSASITGAYVRELVALARLPEEQGTHLVMAATECCIGIVACDDAPGEREPLHLVAVLTPRSLTLQIHERGAPFDPSDTTTAASGAPIRGPAWERIRRAVDEARWFNRGSAGMELHLTAHRPDGDITQHLPESELTAFPHEEPQAPAQAYSLRRFRPADAIGVAQCMYRSFGYTYGDADLYYPDRLVHLNETGQLVSLVALDDAGTIVGHLGLERPDLGPIAESSDAAVAPAHRHRHLLERLHALAEDEARRIGLQGLLAYPVTTHPFSQRMDEAVGSHLCGVVLGQLPRSTTFKGITTAPTAQRVSTLLYFKYLNAPPSTIVHAPAHHRAMLDRLYGNLGVATGNGVPTPATRADRLVVSLDRMWGFGEIYVETVGPDTAAEISRACEDLCAVAETEVVYLYLPLAQAGTPELCIRAEAKGFFFGGIGPRFMTDGDALCLQYVRGELDPQLLQIATPFGRELLDYVTAERARVTSAAT